MILLAFFLYSAIDKLLHINNYAYWISKTPLLKQFSKWLPYVVPFVEIVVAIMLITNRWRLLALYASFYLLIAFVGYIITMLNIVDNPPFSYGGLLIRMSWGQQVVYNGVLAFVSMIGIILFEKRINTVQIAMDGK
jgi:hypothetical protein